MAEALIHGDIPASFCREMGFTRNEFMANLRVAFGDGYQVADGGTLVEIPVNDGRVMIRLGAERERRIASLSLPFMEVEFTFHDLDAVQRRAFYTTFSRSFQRGGG